MINTFPKYDKEKQISNCCNVPMLLVNGTRVQCEKCGADGRISYVELPNSIKCNIRRGDYIMDDYGDNFILFEDEFNDSLGIYLSDRLFQRVRWLRETHREGVVDTPGGGVHIGKTLEEARESAHNWLKENIKYITINKNLK